MDDITNKKTEFFAALDGYNRTAVTKRLKRELDVFFTPEWNLSVEYLSESSGLKITIIRLAAQTQSKYVFMINNNYPFTPPTLYFQDRPYMDFLRQSCKYANSRKILKKVAGLECFCCSSMVCNSNWSPSITFSKIIREVDYYKEKKHDVVNSLIAGVIKRKYLIADIDLDSWLYASP